MDVFLPSYGMPLLNIVGVTPLDRPYIAGLVFMPDETTESYCWALQQFNKLLKNAPSSIVTDRELGLMAALNVVFPTSRHLLCIWHIQKNVLANTKKLFPNGEDWVLFQQEWTELMYSRTYSMFDSLWSQMQLKWVNNVDALNYLNTTWLSHKERFVTAWTNTCFHLGKSSSSMVEGSHAILKKYLHSSTGDLFTVVNQFALALHNQRRSIEALIAKDKLRQPHRLMGLLFEDVIGKISTVALLKVNASCT